MKQNKITLFSNSEYDRTVWTKAIEAIIISLVILVPVVFYPRCITVFIPAKKMVAEVLVIAGLMFWGFKIIDRGQGKPQFRSTPLNLPVLSFILICALSLLWSNNIYASLRELPLFLAGPLLYFLTINNLNDQSQVNRILGALVIVGGLFGIYGIFQYEGIDFPIWSRNIGRQQVFGLFGNVNYFAEYLIVPLPLAVSLFLVSQNRRRRGLLLIAILAMGASLIVTFTRGSYLGFGVSLIFMFVLFLIHFHWREKFLKNKKKIFTVMLAVIVVIVFIFLIPNPLNKPDTIVYKIKNRISLTQLSQDSSLKRRIAIWKFTVMMIKDRPLLGSGIGTYKYNTLSYQAKFFAQGENRSLYPHGFAQEAHNEYLQLGAEMGIVGLGIFIWLIITYFRYGLKSLRKIKDESKKGILIGLMGSVVAILVDSLFGFPLHLPATVILFWLALGLTVVVGREEDNKGKGEQKIINSPGTAEGYGKTEKIVKVESESINKKRKDINNSKTGKMSILKPILYVGVILLALFLSISVIRPFIARTYWYQANAKANREITGTADINETIDMYFQALKWDPYLGEVYYEIGKILMQNGYYTPALEYFEKAEKYVDLPALPLDMARLYKDKGMLDEAAVKLKQAISYQENEQSMLPLYSELGNIYLQLERYKPAELTFKDALKINADFVNGHYGLGIAYVKQNLLSEALNEFQKVIEIAPDSREADYARINIQQLKKAMADYE
jgi:O-antigen ligase/Tfp pilus assembly protein PilF